jgi:hypothetical protein
MLRGLILLGSRDNTDQEIVDLPAAMAAFKDAVKYAALPNSKITISMSSKTKTTSVSKCFYEQDRENDIFVARVEAICMAGWAAYCAGDFSASIREYIQATEEAPQNPKPHYYLAKLYFHIGRKKEGIEKYEMAIRLSPIYSLMIEQDEDFIRYASEINQTNDTYRKQMLAAVSNLNTHYSALLSEKTENILNKHHHDTSQPVIFLGVRKAFTSAQSPNATIIDLSNILIAIESGVKEISQAVVSTREKLRHTILSSKTDANSQSFSDIQKPSEETSTWLAVLFSIVIIIFLVQPPLNSYSVALINYLKTYFASFSDRWLGQTMYLLTLPFFLMIIMAIIFFFSLLCARSLVNFNYRQSINSAILEYKTRAEERLKPLEEDLRYLEGIIPSPAGSGSGERAREIRQRSAASPPP